jgi:branched-chain amino acid transport system substrate-binding protein
MTARRLFAILALAPLLAGAAFAGKTSSQRPIKIGLLADCGGAFGGWYQISLAGAELPLLQRGGARLAGKNPSDGVVGASVAGRPITLVVACGDGTVESALIQSRQLVEKVGVDVLIGPTTGEQEIALQEYARRRPSTTFVNGAGSAHVPDPAPNFFSFHTDGAQWMAGLGSYAYHRLGWRTAATITGPFSVFDWAETAGFVAEFCALGGTITKRISVPPATSDYSAIVAQVPRSGVDGFMVASTDDTVLALADAFPELRRHAARRLILGTEAMLDSRVARLGPGAAGLVTGGIFYGNFGHYVAAYRKAFPRTGAALAGGAFDLFYYDAMAATLDALAAVHGDLSADEKPFMAALAHVDLNAPNGRFTPDPHRQAVGPNLVLALQWPKIAFRVLRTIPIVEPSFGGYFTAHDPPPGEQTPKCVKRTPPPWATTR